MGRVMYGGVGGASFFSFVCRQVCLSRDTHGWGVERLREMHAKWEPTPDHMILMDVKVQFLSIH